MSQSYRQLLCGAALLACTFFIPKNLKAQDVLMQGFYWNTHPGDVSNTTAGGVWWDTIATVAPILKNAGFQTVWTPPMNKGFAGIWDMGYGPYDYFDFGQLNSKGTTRTRHGSKTQHDNMISVLHTNGLKVMADVVLNHRGGADGQSNKECLAGTGNTDYNIYNPPSLRIPATAAHFHPNNTHCSLSGDIYAPVFFQDICHFNQSDANPPTNIDGTPGSWYFGQPNSIGSMGDSLIMWTRYLVNNVGYDELRLDAVKHFEPDYLAKFLVESKNGTQPFAVGESFDYSISALTGYLDGVQNSTNDGNVKAAKLSMFDFPLRGSLKSILNTTNGSADLYQTLGNAGLVWGGGRSGFDVVTWIENHDTDRQGYIGAVSGCPIPAGNSCLQLNTQNDHDPVVSDKEDMGYPFLMAAEGRPMVFWKDYFWYGMKDDVDWVMNLRKTLANGTSTKIADLNGFWPTTAPFDGDNHGGNIIAFTRNSTPGTVFAINDHATKKGGLYVNTPFNQKWVKDYSDGFLFKANYADNTTRFLIEANARDYSWWSLTGLYPSTETSHFTMQATAGECPHFIAIRAANASNLIVNGAAIGTGDEIAVKNAAGNVVGIGRVGQSFKWDGVHDMIIEALGGTGGMASGEAFRVFVFDASANAEIEIGTVQFSAAATNFTFAPDRPNSPNRNGNFPNFSVTTTAAGVFACQGISQIVAFNTQVAVNQNVCGAESASNAPYSDGWQSGDGGNNLGTWTLSSSGTAGFFIGNSANNGDGDGNSDGDINSSGQTAWGTYANSGGQANAVRTLASPLVAGSTFSIKMDNGYLQTGGTVGFGLRNSSNENLLEFYYRGGDAVNSYKKNDLAGEGNIGVGFTDEGLTVAFSFPTATTYTATVTNLNGGTVTNFSGSLQNPPGGQSITNLRLFNANAGSGGSNDAFFNYLVACYPPTLIINEFDYDQPTTDNAEFLELKNVSSSTVNLDNYSVELLNSGGTVYTTVDLPNINLAAADYYVICNSGSSVSNCDLNFAGATDQISDGAPAAIRLKINSLTTDAVSYEGSVAGAVEDSGSNLADSDDAANASLGLSRTPDGDDSDNNNNDFVLTCVTPGTANIANSDADNDGVKVCQGDCDDNDANEFPGQTWYIDADGDDYGGSSVVQCLRPTNGFLSSELLGNTNDCNDSNANIHPNATELCNSLDDDCDSQTDEGLTQVQFSAVVGNQTNCTTPNGSVNVTVTAGTSPRTFAWSNAATAEDLSNLAAGGYSVTITSSQGCTASSSFTVQNTAQVPNLSFTVTDASCFGNSNGSIFTTITNSTTPVTYLWSNGKTTKNINLLAANTYALTATNGNGCTATGSATVGQPTAVNFTLASAPNGSNYDVTVSATGGTPGYTYNRTGVSGFQMSNVFLNVPAGNYIFKVKDSKNCQKSRIKAVPIVGSKPGKGNQILEWELTEREQELPDEVLLAAFARKISGEAIYIFPNPVQDELTVIFSEMEKTRGQLQVIDLLGRVLQDIPVNFESEGNVQKIATDRLPQGNFRVVFRCDDGSVLQKQFVKI